MALGVTRIWRYGALLAAGMLAGCGGAGPSSNLDCDRDSGASTPTSGSTSTTGSTTATTAISTTVSNTGASSAQAMGQAAAARLLMQGTMGASLADLSTASTEATTRGSPRRRRCRSARSCRKSLLGLNPMRAWRYEALNGSISFVNGWRLCCPRFSWSPRSISSYIRRDKAWLITTITGERRLGQLSQLARRGLASP